MPPGACDTHAHVVAADAAAYPLVPERTYTPPPAPESAYLGMLKQTGMARGVLVQISVYGTDNRYMLEVLRRHPDQLRGIGVVAPTVTDSELADMHAAGVRGLRINVLFGGGIGFDAMETLAHRIAGLGWHMQFLMDARQLPALLPRMRKLPVPGVVDHMGHMPVAEGVNSAGFQALQHLVRDHGWWVKLSGAYRISDRFDDFSDVVPWAQALIETAPDRMLWGSDWPHVHQTRMVNTGRLRNQLALWAPDAALRHRILVDNPARLYGFTPAL
ncbi:amidohydrolase family protein [Achromobacter marplatensis]